ncbi:hypothetical protein [Saccharibacillus sacchari]|uniref:Uncharacterized protein n=1 Tax=Saccharibacillus sacchari TaxID=456493 RepID=A0ACC6PH35_9BACL
MNGLRVLITGGRAPCALDLARGFAARGAEVYTAESLEFPLCAASRAVKRNFRVPAPAQDAAGYAAALREIVRSEGIRLLLPTCEEIFYISAYRSSFGPDCRVLAPSLESLRELHSKWAFIALCARLGFAVPETFRLGEDGEARIAGEAPPLRSGEPAYLLKPEFSRFSARLSRHETLDEARAQVQREGGVWVAQRYAGSEMLCTYAVAHEGRLLAHAAYRAPQTASGASVCFRPDNDPQAREWVDLFVQRTGFSGQIAFDFIRTQNGMLLPIECNPRATSGVHLLLAPQVPQVQDGSATEPGLLDALANPDTVAKPLIANPAQTPMLLLPMLGSGLGQLHSPKRIMRWFRDFRGSRDVLLRRGDSAVLPRALRMMLELRRRARLIGKTTSEASVFDIGWNGQPIGDEAFDGRPLSASPAKRNQPPVCG